MIEEAGHRFEAGKGRQLVCFFQAVLLRNFHINGFIFFKVDGYILPDMHLLVFQADQVAFTCARNGVVGRKVFKLCHVKICVQFPVDTLQQIEIKSAGDAGGIVVGVQDHLWMFFKIEAGQQQVAGLQVLP